VLAASGAALVVLVTPDPGSSAANATVRVSTSTARAGRDGRATLALAPGAYDVVVEKPGFAPARAHVVVTANGTTVRIALHAAPTSALRTIGAVAAAERGAFNRAPDPIAILAREGYRDQGQPGTTTVLTQTPSIAIDRAARGLAPFIDAPPVALVRGGTPLETQLLLEGVPIAMPTTRTLALSAIPAFVTQEVEVDPGQGAPLTTVDGALNGTVNLRFAEPTPVWRALPEFGQDSRGGSFADVAAGGASADRRIGIALAATSNGALGTIHATDTIQRALLLKGRASLSPAATLTATTYAEGDTDHFGANDFNFSEAELRLGGAHDIALARWWHANATRDVAAAGDPFEDRTDDALTGGSLELDHIAGEDLYSLGASETYGTGTADGFVVVSAGSFERVQTAFARAIVHPARRVETQLAFYEIHADGRANHGVIPTYSAFTESALLGRIGAAYRASDRTTLRASIGAGFTPPSLVALASIGKDLGFTASGTYDLGLEQRIIDRQTTLSADIFASREVNRLIQAPFGTWTNAGSAARRGLEFSLARHPAVGFGFLLQAWTTSETPALLTTVTGTPAPRATPGGAPTLVATSGDVGSGNTHGYTEISYHGAQGSRISLGATYLGADPSLAQPATVILNTNLEIQVGIRGKIQFSIENLNDAHLAVISPLDRFLAPPNALGLSPRTVRLLVRRSFGRTSSDG